MQGAPFFCSRTLRINENFKIKSKSYVDKHLVFEIQAVIIKFKNIKIYILFFSFHKEGSYLRTLSN